MQILGIDIGGSGIKGAPVDTETGQLLNERHRIPTPQPITPKAVAKTVASICAHFDWSGPIGCGFPAVIQHSVARSAANIESTWIGTDVAQLFEKATGCPVSVVNDADGLTERHLGAGRGHDGVVILSARTVKHLRSNHFVPFQPYGGLQQS